MSVKFSKSKRIAVGNKFEWHCAYCGLKLNDETLVIDHIIPRSQGGSNDINNLFPTCRSCNSSKGVKTLEQFRLYLTFKKAVPVPDFNQSHIEFLNQRGLLPSLGVGKRVAFYFEVQNV